MPVQLKCSMFSSLGQVARSAPDLLRFGGSGAVDYHPVVHYGVPQGPIHCLPIQEEPIPG